MKRKKPSFNETYHGYRTFSELLLDAQKEGLLELEIDRAQQDVCGDALRHGDEEHASRRGRTEEAPQAVAQPIGTHE